MSASFRRPFMVESTRRLYNGMGQTDPERRTFATFTEALDYWHDATDEGAEAYICERNPSTGEWEC